MPSATDRQFERRLSALVNAREPRVLQEGLRGVEKESLRVLPDGHIARSPHPYELGSALTHEHITTDFSEALIELVSKIRASDAWKKELDTRKWTDAFMTERPFERDLAKDIADKEVLMKELGLA